MEKKKKTKEKILFDNLALPEIQVREHTEKDEEGKEDTLFSCKTAFPEIHIPKKKSH